MALNDRGSTCRHLSALFSVGVMGTLSDAQLLERFNAGRGEAAELAFRTLIERHGPMVLRVCRGVLRNAEEAEDAFQATFLILVRRADMIWTRETLGPWLYKVAHRTACSARRSLNRRQHHEQFAARQGIETHLDRGLDDLEEVIQDELGRLPHRYRDAIVLCLLEGHTPEQASHQLGCPVGTVHSRLARGRELLRGRLNRRGFGASATLLFVGLSRDASVTNIPPTLMDSTMEGVARLMVGITAGSNSETIRLMERVVTSMKFTQLKMATAVLVAVSAATGAAVLAQKATVSGKQVPPIVEVSKLSPRGAGDAAEDRSPGKILIAHKAQGHILKGHSSAVFSLAFAPDGKTLASGDGDRNVKIWDLARFEERLAIQVKPHQCLHAAVMAMAWGRAPSLLALACDDRTIRLIDTATEKERTLIPQNCFANTVAFSPDGKLLAWGGTNPNRPDTTDDGWKVITLWDVATEKVRTILKGHSGGISSLAFSSDGKRLVSGSYDQTARLWEMESGKEVAVFKAPNEIHGIAISPDGRSLAAAITQADFSAGTRIEEKSVTMMLWDVATRTIRSAVPANQSSSFRVAFSPDSRVLASAGTNEGLIKLWDVQTGNLRAILQGHRGNIYSLTFSPDGKKLASSGIDSTVRLWELDPDTIDPDQVHRDKARP